MKRQHQIDHAEFDTALCRRVDPSQQAGLDDFVRTELLRVVDQVFDDMDLRIGAARYRLERLEIDLGEIDWRDYREQMPQRLRRQLWQALENARYSGASTLEQSSPWLERSTTSPALLHFLRHGYLPGNAGIADLAELQNMLLAEFENNPGRLRNFITGSGRRDLIMDRITAQFSPGLGHRVRQLIGMTDGTPIADSNAPLPESGGPAPSDAAAASVDSRPQPERDTGSNEVSPRARLEAALAANRPAPLQRLLHMLLRQDAATLAQVLRDLGRHSRTRQALARLLSPAQFAELVRLVEPSAPAMVLALLEQPRWLEGVTVRGDTESQVREYLLGYLLVERGPRFDLADLIDSLLRQIAAADSRPARETRQRLRENLQRWNDDEGLLGELARSMLTRIGRETAIGSDDSDPVEAYTRFARVAGLFSPAGARPDDPEVLADIEFLMRRAPWLALRLIRELQAEGGWRTELARFSEELLTRLVQMVLTIFDQVITDQPSPGSAELAAAIARNAERATNRQAYYAEIFSRLVADGLIDFEQLRDVESFQAPQQDGEHRNAIAGPVREREQVLQQMARLAGGNAMGAVPGAELIITASLSAGLQLSPSRLREIKWRLLRIQFEEYGVLFDLPRFARGAVDALLQAAGIKPSAESYARIAQALLANSLPATRELTRRIIEALQDVAAQAPATPRAERDAVESSPVNEFDEIAPEEDVHIDNAGLVLLAPWLPRLFEQFELVEDGQFRDRAAAERAVHCAQFLVDGSTDSPEFRLVLNKLLCGVRPGKPIRRSIELTGDEIGQLESLLTAVTQHWKALENTSIDGLRESFLQRGGRLQRRHDAWHLQVESRAFDMLLDQIPWSFSTIKLGWMDRIIYVDWR